MARILAPARLCAGVEVSDEAGYDRPMSAETQSSPLDRGLPIVARNIDRSGVASGEYHRVIRLEPTAMLLASAGLRLLTGQELDFQVTLFRAISFRVRGKISPTARDAEGECTVRFTEIDRESRRLLDEAFQRFSHLAPEEVGEIASRLGQGGRKRVAADLDAALIIGEILISGRLENISEGGAFFATGQVLPLNAEGMLVFMLPDSSREIRLQVRVIWHWEEIKHGWKKFNPGAGLQFIGGRYESFKAVTDFVLRRLET